MCLSLNSNLLQLRRRSDMAGQRGQFTPGGYLSTLIHTTLAGIEPTTFRFLIQRATSSATYSFLKKRCKTVVAAD